MVSDALNKPYDKVDKLRLVLLFALRYETDTNSIAALVKKLRDSGIPDEYANYVSWILDYAGKSQRLSDLYGKRDSIVKFRSKMKDIFAVNLPDGNP